MTLTRNAIATELLRDCPAESLADHTRLAEMIRRGESLTTILDTPEANRWPETHSWLKSELSVTLGQWTGDLEVAANLMDAEIREGLHHRLAPCSDQEFLDAYAVAHREKFSEDFVVA
jgi:hypothetical protein